MADIPLDAETIRESYTRSIASTRSIIDAVRDDQWSNDTPCGEWDVKDIVNHLVNENLWMVALFGGKTIEEVGDAYDGDLVGDDPIGVYNKTVDDVLSVLAEDDAMTRICHISSGPTSGANYAGQLFLDTLVHGWDISVGARNPAKLDPELVEACMPIAEMTAKYAAGTGLFAEPVKVDENVDQQVKLLAILGRDS